MKRDYVKPFLYIETFELLEHIAKCNANPSVTNVTYRGPEACAYQDGGLNLFYNGVQGCEMNEENIDTEVFGNFEEFERSFVDDGGCYNAFSDGNFFAS